MRALWRRIVFRYCSGDPLVDVLATPIIIFQQVRCNLFFDIGAANFKGQPFTFQKNQRLVDGAASLVARRFDGKNTIGKTKTEFWIGETF